MRLALGLLFAFCPYPLAAAMAPMNGPLALLAGNGQIGFADGPFLEAKFNSPQGVVLAPDGKTLYVADSGNHRIRSIDLTRRIAVVSTLSGGKSGTQDGTLDAARFVSPEGLFPWSKGLVLIDDKKTLRSVDLQAKTVTTIFHSNSDLVAYADTGGPEWLVMNRARELFAVAGVSSPARTLPFPDTGFQGDSLLVVRENAFVYDQFGVLFKADLGQLLALSATSGVWAVAGSPGSHDGTLLRYSDPSDGSFALLVDHGHRDLLKVLPSFGAAQFNAYGAMGTMSSLTSEERRMAGQIGGAAHDALARCIYYSDPPSNRILRLKEYRYAELGHIESNNSEGLREFEYPKTVPADTTRIAFVGSSMAFKSPRLGDFERVRSLPKRFETWLNLLSSLQGCPRAYEVLGYVEPASGSTTIPIRATEYAQRMKDHNVAEIWLDVDYINLCDELVGWLLKGQWAGQVDPPSFLASTPAEKAKLLPPDVAHMREELVALQKKYIPLNVYSFDAKGSLLVGYSDRFGSWYQILEEPGLRKEMVALYRQSLLRMKAKLQETWAPGAVPPITLLHVPVRNVLNMSECDWGGRDPGGAVIDDFFDKELAAMAKDLGFGFVSNLDAGRVLSPSYNPMFVPSDNHMTRSGQDMNALAAAIRLLKRDGCPAP